MEKSHLIRNRKIVLIFASILFLVIIGLSIFFTIDNSHKTATVNILVAPTFATVEIDHHKFSTDTTIKYYPGNYTAKISADGFESQEITLELSPDQATDLYLYLTPNSDRSNFYQQNTREATRMQTIVDYLATKSATEYTDEHPITNILPIIVVESDPETFAWTEFRIDYGKFKSCKSDFCLKITDSTGGNRDRAINLIREKGFNPNDYEIIYSYVPPEPLP